MNLDLVFGWRTALLLVAFLQLLLLAAALMLPLRNRTANLTMAALMFVLAGIITPWMIGFAGFYDRWRWLSFAPFAISLAIAPLSYLYVRSLLFGHWPARAWVHLSAPAAQFFYLAAAFLLLREPLKNDWLSRSGPAYDGITGLGVIVGLCAYGTASWRLIREYRSFIADQRSDDHRFALAWLERAASALFVLLAVWAIYGGWNLVDPLGYRGLMGLYVAIAAFALYLGIEGWRHSSTPFPKFEKGCNALPPTNWERKAAGWAERVKVERLYADPELSVPRLSRILGTNSSYVSRAFNAGIGETFSGFINRLRSEEVSSRWTSRSLHS